VPIDVNAIAPAAKAHYIAIGERWGSETTLAQADDHLANLPTHGPLLAKFGFGIADGARLADARDGLLAAGVQRASAVVGDSAKRAAVADALAIGKDERATARSVLASARRELFESTAPDAEAAIAMVDGVLAKTSAAGASPTELGNQLAVLKDALTTPVVAAAAKDRGGPDAVTALEAALGKTKAVPSAIKRGTPAETELLNLYDGMIVELCRSARKAARAAARKTGQPAVAKVFELRHLGRSRGGEAEPDGEKPAPAPGPTP
jgi:hypothetical protein